jgi:ABC-type transport system involved in cytochrome c biogenesis permease subunit
MLAGGVCRAADDGDLSWDVWRRLPVFGQWRVLPLDTFARETVETICGRPEPTIILHDGLARRFSAAELLFRWLIEPEQWEKVPFLIAEDEELRTDVLGLPLYDDQGRRLRYVSPVEVETNAGLGRRWAELRRQAGADGKSFRPAGVDKKIKDLVDAFGKFRMLTFDPNAPKDAARRFYDRVRSAAAAWRKLAGDLHGARRISRDDEIRKQMVRAGESLQKLIAQVHGGELSREKVEGPASAFRQASERLSARLASSADKPMAALAADLGRQAIEMHLALYDNGEALCLVPSLSPAAIELDRPPGDDASPWLSIQAMLLGSDDLMRPYPQAELKAARKAWAGLKAAYLDRAATDRSTKFAAAMDRFADAIRALGTKVGPLRENLPVLRRDQELIDATAYPPPGSTDVEVLYNRVDPLFWSWIASLAATLCLVFAVGPVRKPMFWLGVAVLLLAQSLTAAGLGLRGYVMGLVPLTGMYESVVFVAFYAAMLGLWFALTPLWRLRTGDEWCAIHCPPIGSNPTRVDCVLQRRLFAVAGATVSFVAMALAYYAPATVMHRNIGSVAPILRDNFWLAVHVVTIMASYASAAIALILGNIALGYYLFGRYVAQPPSAVQGTATAEGGRATHQPPEACRVLAGFTYSAIKITVLLLAAGTILGALWADKAWGRFWAWDPKEVWALISLLVYLFFLHARHIGWSGDFGVALMAVLGASAIVCTWYWVNFFMGSGMHSYGAGAGGQWQVAIAMLLQGIFVLAAGVRHLSMMSAK